jgi:hypothetical protein
MLCPRNESTGYEFAMPMPSMPAALNKLQRKREIALDPAHSESSSGMAGDFNARSDRMGVTFNLGE